MKIQNKNIFAIIPSAGTGTRFGTTIPKQYIEIDHEPVIQKTITKFINIEEIKKIFVVLSPNDRDFDNLEISTNQKIVKVEGGDSRAESVLNALKKIKEDSIVLVHDAVRPFIEISKIKQLIQAFDSSSEEALVLGIPIYEALKKIDPETLAIKSSQNRNEFYLAQTPQISSSKLLEHAIESSLGSNFFPGDESEAIERAGGRIKFIPGNRSNIKITVPEDLEIDKIGNGFDSHRFKKGDGLMIGGYKVDCNFSFDAHSDGDIVLHALADSMLGALSLGDIGQHFPNTTKWKNCPGKEIYKLTEAMIKEKGFSLKQIDIIVVLEEPKLLPHRLEILSSLSELTGLDKENIGFKAKTSEKMSFIGKNEGAAAFVLSKLKK